MTPAPAAHSTAQKTLRLWPGVIAVVLLWLARFGIKAVVPGFNGFSLSVQGGILGAVAVILWWVFLSRARWLERLGGLALMIAALFVTSRIAHESMGLLWLVAYALPMLCLAFVAWAVTTRRLPDSRRRLTMVATIIVACGAWTAVRTDGINGDHNAQFRWRWTETREEQLLAQAVPEPAPPPALPPAAEAPSELPVIETGDNTAPLPPTPTDAHIKADWPGFRGAARDSIVRGVRIATDWSALPPSQIWRRPIGPGWSSFAVRGDLLYTQEQRGDEEIVAAYRVSTGEPVWRHADAARFFESNGGAGPRGTPTLSDRSVYTFGATGMLNVLDADDGRVFWSRDVATDTDTGIPAWGFSSSPLVIDDLVIVAAAGQLVAYERSGGAPRWRGPAGGGSYSSPQLMTIDGVAQVVLLSDAGATSVAPATGTLLWEHRWPGSPIVQPALTADGDILISASAGSGTRRITAAHGPAGWTVEEHWTSSGLKPYFNDFVVHEGYAFGFDGRILACIGLADGARVWKGGRYGNGQLVLLPDQDLLLVLSEEGELALVKATPEAFTELARFPAVTGKTWNHPVLVGDVLLVRNGEEMVAFRLPLASR